MPAHNLCEHDGGGHVIWKRPKRSQNLSALQFFPSLQGLALQIEGYLYAMKLSVPDVAL